MINQAARRSLGDLLGERVEFDAPLARHTSLRIGGPADALATPLNRTELAETLAICHEHGLATRVLGAGFNVLVSDAGLRAGRDSPQEAARHRARFPNDDRDRSWRLTRHNYSLLR